MNIEELRNYVIGKPGVEETFPFGETTLVFKVNGKMFMAVGLDREPLQFNVKCDPERALELREEYACILPGYHMNKKHWNTVVIDRTLTNRQLKEQIDHSYDIVANAKKKK
jgi:predicted DNA-binding protein (MmcQ/YjbR family)